MSVTEERALRIGELSRRVGVSADVLRAWERRYGLLQPSRTAGGFRLYSAEDERRVRTMQGHLERGVAAAEAARLALAEPLARAGGWEDDARRLAAALEAFDEQGAQLAFDRLLAALTVETLLSDVLLPYLRELGERWARGEVTVAQEHFASNVLRGRLLGLARGWGRGGGAVALLACPPGELHDLPLIAFGIALHGRGWRIVFLGPDTPVETLALTATGTAAQLVVLSAVEATRFEDVAEALASVARRHPLVLAGAGATPAVGDRIGAAVRHDGPIAAADVLAAGA